MTDGISSADGLSQADDVSAADGVSRDGSVPRDGISTANDILPADAISAGHAVWGADASARSSARRVSSETMRSGIADAVSRTAGGRGGCATDRKSTRLNSSHQIISYAVFCLKKKKPRCRI